MSRLFKGAFLRVGVSAAALSLIIYSLRSKLGEAFEILRTELRWEWFFVAIGTYVAVQCFMSYRLYRIFRIHGIAIRYAQTLYLSLVGLFFNLFLPSAVGGDIAKIYYACRHSGKKIEATSAVILDRLTGFLSIMLIACCSLIFVSGSQVHPQLKNIVLGFIAVVVSIMAMILNRRLANLFSWVRHFLPTQKIREKAALIYQALYECKKHPLTLLLCLGISLLGQSLIILLHYLLAGALGTAISPGIFFLLIPLVTIASMAPSLGGLGVREAGGIYLFSQYMSAERAVALFLLVDLLIYGFGFFAGLVYSLNGGLKAQEVKAMESVA